MLVNSTELVLRLGSAADLDRLVAGKVPLNVGVGNCRGSWMAQIKAHND